MGSASLPVPSYESPLTSPRWLHPSPSRYNAFVPPVSQAIRVKVLFFGRLKDVVGHSEESLEVSDASTIEHLFALYTAQIPKLSQYRSSLVASRNQEFASWDTPLHAGDEIAFLPPVSGG
jgi:sulfur-carrier protein